MVMVMVMMSAMGKRMMMRWYTAWRDMYSKLCNSMQSLFSCRSSSPTTNTFDPNFFDRKGFFC